MYNYMQVHRSLHTFQVQTYLRKSHVPKLQNRKSALLIASYAVHTCTLQTTSTDTYSDTLMKEKIVVPKDQKDAGFFMFFFLLAKCAAPF